ncbi:hypothetical protein V7094_28480 [Priestia megaterium]|uniref:hypothetical protein n=1 Tax=Priestia megaterium TaxID=1404 RepID=UPI002FFEFEAF
MKPKDYKESEFIHFIRKGNGDSNTVKAKNGSERKHPKYDMYEVPFEDIDDMKLDKYGENIPFTRNNVVNLERYILRYWQPIIGSDAVMLLLNLWEYCNRDEGVDICYPKIGDLAEMMGRSKPIITKNLQLLEDNNFLIIIHRLNKLSNNRETSPVFKLRQTVPLLSIEQYNMLPTSLQEKHDEYMRKFGRDAVMDRFTYQSNDLIDEITAGSELIVTNSVRKSFKEALRKAQAEEFLLTKLPDGMRDTLKKESLMDELESAGMSKPVRDMFFKDTMSLYDIESSTVHLLVKDKESKAYFTAEDNSYMSNIMLTAFGNLYGDISSVKYFTIEDYAYKTLKGK